MRSFSDINVPQGSVVTRVRCVGTFNKCFAANLLENLKKTVKKFENRLTIKSYRKKVRVSLFWNTVSLSGQ